MTGNMLSFALFSFLAVLVSSGSLKRDFNIAYMPADDTSFPPKQDGVIYDFCEEEQEFRYKWVGLNGTIHEEPDGEYMLEVAATMLLSEEAHDVGTEIISLAVRNMPDTVFIELTQRGTVGLFTAEEKTTIFPEYCQYRDRPECEGTCEGECSNTCTSDGRKYDDLAGLGGTRATCLDDNFMCTDDDPYLKTDNILVHEFVHTVHQYGLRYADDETDWYAHIQQAWANARANNIWDTGSYAMSTHLEYFAEGGGVFFNVNHHYSSTGGMNGCGRPPGQFCETEEEARAWLQSQDPDLYLALIYTFTEYQDHLPGGLHICQSENRH